MRVAPAIRPTIVVFALWIALTHLGAAAQGHALTGATPVAVTGWVLTDSQPITVDGLPVALSPDGAWIAGVGPEGNDLCVWALPSLDAACDAQEAPIDPHAIVWSPDSTAVAFASDAAFFLRESDIGVFEVETGELTVLTEDGAEGDVFGIGEDVPVDIMPAFTADSTSLVFARSFMTTQSGTGSGSTYLAQVSRTGGEVETLATVSEEAALAIGSPLHVLAGGEVVYAQVIGSDGSIMVLGTDGQTRELVAGTSSDAFPLPVITDVLDSDDERVLSGYSPAQYAAGAPASAFLVDIDTADITPLAGDTTVRGPVSFSPGGTATVGLEGNDLVIRQGDQMLSLGQFDGSFSRTLSFAWASNNTILAIDPGGAATLVTVAPAG